MHAERETTTAPEVAVKKSERSPRRMSTMDGNECDLTFDVTTTTTVAECICKRYGRMHGTEAEWV